MHSLTMHVRDYECDLQGIVNNAQYQHYLEHARHEYLLSKGLSFAKLTQQQIHLVVYRMTLNYHHSLLPGDAFEVRSVWRKPSRVKLLVEQQVYRPQDDNICLSANVEIACLNPKGRPCWLPQFEALIMA